MSNYSSLISSEEVSKIFRIFETFKKNSIFLVGGCIRDAILQKDVTDIDFATSLTPDETTNLLDQNNIQSVDVGKKYGTVTAIINQKKYEITSFRKDISTDGRHATVTFTKDMKEDAQRRDFTFNALYVDSNGKIFDFYNGQEDLKNGNVIFIGDPNERIKEDYLRILRYFRFFALFENSDIDPDLQKVFTVNHAHLSNISNERKWHEFKEILKLKTPHNSLHMMESVGILKTHFEGALLDENFKNLIEIESRIRAVPNPIIRLSTLIGSSLEKTNHFINSFPLSKADSTELLKLSSLNKKIVSYLSMKEVRYLLYKLGKTEFQNQIIINWSRDTQNKNEVNWRSLYEVADNWTKPDFGISPKDIINMGIEQGPMVGRIMSEVEDWWAENDFIDDKFSLIERLKAIVQAQK